jgi:RNA polymerase sigma factor (sigma-70 family)
MRRSNPPRVSIRAVERAISAEAALVVRCGAGDETAIGLLYDRFGRSAYALARRITGDTHLAEEVVQEAFLDAWRAAQRFEPKRASVATWLFTFVHRRAVDAVRRAAVRPRTFGGDVDALPEQADTIDVLASVVTEDEANRLRRAMSVLPDRERRVLELAYVEGLSQSEIAEALGEPLGTVKSRTHAALARMRGILGEHA